MNLEIFFEALGRHRDKLDAGFIGKGGIGPIRVTLPVGMFDTEPDIAGKPVKMPFTPLTAVCFFETGEYYTVDKWRGAAEALGMNENVAAELVIAEDSVQESDTRSELLQELALTDLRKQLAFTVST